MLDAPGDDGAAAVFVGPVFDHGAAGIGGEDDAQPAVGGAGIGVGRELKAEVTFLADAKLRGAAAEVGRGAAFAGGVKAGGIDGIADIKPEDGVGIARADARGLEGGTVGDADPAEEGVDVPAGEFDGAGGAGVDVQIEPLESGGDGEILESAIKHGGLRRTRRGEGDAQDGQGHPAVQSKRGKHGVQFAFPGRLTARSLRRGRNAPFCR